MQETAEPDEFEKQARSRIDAVFTEDHRHASPGDISATPKPRQEGGGAEFIDGSVGLTGAAILTAAEQRGTGTIVSTSDLEADASAPVVEQQTAVTPEAQAAELAAAALAPDLTRPTLDPMVTDDTTPINNYPETPLGSPVKLPTSTNNDDNSQPGSQ